MHFRTWDTLSNILLMIFWFRIWTGDDRSLHFNTYLAPLGKISESAVKFVRPVLFGLQSRMVAVVSLVFLIAFRAVLFHGTSRSGNSPWLLGFGFEINGTIPGTLPAFMVFSVLSFAIFLFKVWGFSLIYVRGGTSSFSNTTNALYHVSRPFSDFDMRFRPFVLLGLGILLAVLLNVAGTRLYAPGSPIQSDPTSGLAAVLRYSVSTIAEWVRLLVVLRSLIILLIIGSWVSMFTGSRGIAFFCRDWLDMLMGPLRRYPLRIGTLDLTPLIVILAIQMVIYPVLINILLASYEKLV